MSSRVKTQIKTPITYYGGKQNMVKHILPLVPEHTRYVESFFGGGALFFSKEPSEMEVINDLNREAINFYEVLKSEYYKLNALIRTTLHSREQYEDAKAVYKSPHLFDKIRRAWAFWVLTQMGFSSQIGTWAVEKSKNSRALCLTNKKEAFTIHLQERLEQVQIECKDANLIIKQYDSPGTFHYIDPPYFNSDCGHYKGYGEHDFVRLLETLTQVKGKFLLSNYPSPALERFCKEYNWNKLEFEKNVSVTCLTNKKKVEVLVANYPLN